MAIDLSRVETILNGNYKVLTPDSRIEAMLIDLMEKIDEGGGGGGDLSNYYTKKEVNDLLDALEEEEDGKIATEVAAGIAKVVADAPESLDTLKEIADWIEAHPEDTAAMNSQIQENKENIETLTENQNNFMNKENPEGNGSLVINKKEGSSVGNNAVVTGYNNIASGDNSHVEGGNNKASSYMAHAEGNYTEATSTAAHSEGQETKANGGTSHAEGYKTTASGDNSHAEGNRTTASGKNSHAEGYKTQALYENSHAGGEEVSTGNKNSFAHGLHLSQAVLNDETKAPVTFGAYNDIFDDYNRDDLFQIGNGTQFEAHNAFRVDSEEHIWDGEQDISQVVTDLKGISNNTTQMLRGTNSNKTTATGLWSDSAWNVTGEVISVANAPDPNIKYGYSLTKGKKITQKDIQSSDNNKTDYVVSFYCKGTGKIDVEFMYEEGAAWNPSYMSYIIPIYVDGATWNRYEVVVEKDNIGSDTYHLGLGIGNSSTEETTLQICGIKLERGSIATPWSLSPYEMDNSNVDLSDIESDVSNLSSDTELLKSTLGYTTKNLLPMTVEKIKAMNTSGTWSGNTYTLNGVMFDIQTNSNGLMTGVLVNGTPNANVLFYLALKNTILNIPEDDYILNGCPSGGSDSTYFIYGYNLNNGTNAIINIGSSDSNFTLSHAMSDANITLQVRANYTASNLLFQPMIRKSSIADPTFEPYQENVDDRINTLDDENEIVKDTLGYEKKNLFDKNIMSDVITQISIKQIKLEPNTIYTMSSNVPKNSENFANVFFHISEDETNTEMNGIWDGQTRTIVTDDSGIAIVAYRSWFFEDTSADYLLSFDYQIERGTTATDYTPYKDDIDTRLTANETALLTTKTATGNPISVSDSAHTNAEELTVKLEPKQDLNGYDKPWVGGSGKNLAYSQIANTIIANCKKGETYTFSWDGDVNVNLRKGYLETQDAVVASGSSPLTFTADEDFELFFNPWSSGFSNIQLELGSSATQYEPYSNICPITGYDSMSLVRSGKNYIPSADEKTIVNNGMTFHSNGKGKYNINGIATSPASATFDLDEFVIPASDTHTFYLNNNNSGEVTIYFRNNGQIIDSWKLDSVNKSSYSYQQMGGKTCTEMVIVVESGESVNITLIPQILQKSDDRDTYTLQFGETVYGAEVDFVRGIARVTHGFGVFDGSDDEGWHKHNYSNLNAFYILHNGGQYPYADGVAGTFNEFVNGTITDNIASNNHAFVASTSVQVAYNDATTLEDWKTFLSNNPLQAAYKLATPYEIQLTPQQIKMLKGNNVLMADGEMSLEYQADNTVGEIKESIEKEIENLPKELPEVDSSDDGKVLSVVDGAWEKTAFIPVLEKVFNDESDTGTVVTGLLMHGTDSGKSYIAKVTTKLKEMGVEKYSTNIYHLFSRSVPYYTVTITPIVENSDDISLTPSDDTFKLYSSVIATSSSGNHVRLEIYKLN